MTDVTVTAASVQWTGKRDTGISGEAITAGQALFRSTSTGFLELADADVQAESIFAGFALNSAPAAGMPVEYGYGEGLLTIGGTTVSVGATYVVSAANSGGIAPEADLATGDFMTFLGFGASTSTIQCNPYASQVAHG